jgi:PAS domain S-box-containing protein
MMSENLKKLYDLTETLERVESNLVEEKSILEFMLEHTTDGYWDWDIQSGYEYMSPKFKKQLGYEPDEMENKPEAWQAICNEEDLGRAFQVVESHLKGESEEFKETLRFTHKEGHEVKIICRGKVVKRSENGEPLRMIGTHTIIE